MLTEIRGHPVGGYAGSSTFRVIGSSGDRATVSTWAVVDGDGRREPAFYAMRRAYADRLLTVQPRDAHLAVVAVNDSDDAWVGDLVLTRCSFDGVVIAATDLELCVPARASATIAVPDDVERPDDGRTELVVAEVGGVRALWFFCEDRDQVLVEPVLDVTCTPADGGYEVRVTARSLLRDLAVLADKVAPDARVDDMLVTLLPGESAVFRVETGAQVDPDSFADPRVLRSANQLVATAEEQRR